MPRSLQQSLPPMEVNRVDEAREDRTTVVNKVERLLPDVQLAMAKAKVGACVKKAIGPRALKEFGDKGQMSNVVSGEKVPEYLARIYQDEAARRRFARALVEGDQKVKRFTVLQFEDEEVG
jgi:hypothetical protein